MRIGVVRGAGCAIPLRDRGLFGRRELVPLEHRLADQFLFVVRQTVVDERQDLLGSGPLRSFLGETLVERLAFQGLFGGRADRLRCERTIRPHDLGLEFVILVRVLRFQVLHLSSSCRSLPHRGARRATSRSRTSRRGASR